jgi:hypothetical protein
MNLILVQSYHQEELLLQLVREHASRVILPRNFKPSEIFTKYAKEKKTYGILNVTHDEGINEAVFEIALPAHYINFFKYILSKVENQK